MWNRATVEIKMVFIRHGATEWNEEGRYLGHTNMALSRDGRRRLLNKVVPKADVVWVSPMVRCRQTAEIFYPNMEPVVVDAFRELDFGLFEGKNYDELNGNADYQAYIDSGGKIAFPEGEDPKAFVKRTVDGFSKMLNKLLSDMEAAEETKKTVAVVAHGGTVMALMGELIGGDYFSYQVKNGEYYAVRGKMNEEGTLQWNIIS